MKLTPKQAAFVANKAEGLNNRAAAEAAGYSTASAHVRSSELMRRPDIKAAIKAAAKSQGVTIKDDPKAAPSRMRPKYASSLALLQHTYNNPDMPESVRMRAAEQALPYEHARIGEQGKKEKAKERAKEIAGGSKREKFAPKVPPPTMQ
jgi:phage terminase small subunit